MGDRIKRTLFILMRLYRSQAGNTLAIAAAAVIPLAALIGGGVDMSRAYMAKARLQQACDAAALAGRRSMTTSAMTANDIAEAKKFFDFNFPQNTFQTDSFTPNIRSDPAETTTVLVSANTRIPTTIMRIFRYDYINLAVNCSSKFDIGNTDVMLVLDTTGSMSTNMVDTDGSTMTRLAALKLAVKDFYDTLGAGSDATGRIRYGFMPYSSTVNVGYSLPTSALLGGTTGEEALYQTRRRYISSYSSSTSTGSYTYSSGSTTNGSGTATKNGSCPSLPNDSVSQSETSSSSSSTDSSGVITTTTVSTRVTTGTDYSWKSNSSCSRSGSTYSRPWVSVTYNSYTETKTDTVTQTPQYSWQYGYYPQDVSSFIGGNAVSNPTSAPGATTDANGTTVSSTSTWSGCIEERGTDSSITTSTSTASIPATAYDLQIDTAPGNAATKWRPHWPEVMFERNGRWLNDNRNYDYRSGTGGWNACPSKARKLASYSSRSATPTGMSSSFDDYVNGLTAIGGTYHDIGMIWGARFLSPTGIFASENASAPNGFNISRHIVFMTDGDMSAYDAVYGAYGYQKLDGRVAATNTGNTDLTAIHRRRLAMMCNAIKGKGITIWVVGFKNPPPTGTSDADMIDDELRGCANSDNHWFMAYNPSTLRQKFKDIAKNIGGLRLSQ